MFKIVFILALLMILCWTGIHITGLLLSAIIWIAFKLPLAIIVLGTGVACCLTLLLIPVGIRCFGLVGKILF